jgi:hypothetical protein
MEVQPFGMSQWTDLLKLDQKQLMHQNPLIHRERDCLEKSKNNTLFKTALLPVSLLRHIGRKIRNPFYVHDE